MNAESRAIADLVFVAARTPPDAVRHNPANSTEQEVVSDLAVLIGSAEAEKLRFTNIGAVAMMSTAELRNLGLSAGAAGKLRAAFKLAIKAANEAPLPMAKINGPEAAVSLMRDRVALLPHEEVWALFLDIRSRVKADLLVSKMGFNASAVDNRVIFHGAMEVRASSFILVHNHPTGESDPSTADRDITRALVTQGQIMGIRLADHLIITRGGFMSFALAGLI